MSPGPLSSLRNAVAIIPIGNAASTALPNGRKHTKNSLGRGGIDRLFISVYKTVGSKKFGMLLSVLISFISLVVFINIIHLVSYRAVTELRHGTNVSHAKELLQNIRTTSPMDRRKLQSNTSMLNSRKKKAQGVALSSNISTGKLCWPELFVEPLLPLGHPCRGFALPPPPEDKKRTGPRPCPVCYLPVSKAMKTMPVVSKSSSPVLNNLTYIVESNASKAFRGHGSGSAFGGHVTLEQRGKYFQVEESMQIHCGFVQGSRPGIGTGFDIEENDRMDMEQCGVVVASAVFGNYDQIQQPKNISLESRKTVCFYMFIDEETEKFLHKDGGSANKRIGLWRLVVVRNLPYSDARRNGKIPKLLLHRLFPNARFSLWIDGKLELVVDPYQIFERFLWRTNDTFAISRHYRRFDVFEEAEANKAARKYDNASIEAQVHFYKKEGLLPYNTSKFPIISDVPEGCVIVREHTPVTNLFTCLWFNEVDRFTSRDQLSFAIVRDRLMAAIPWKPSMFRDCERRNFVVQAYHRDVMEQKAALSRPSSVTVDTRIKELARNTETEKAQRKTQYSLSEGSRRQVRVDKPNKPNKPNKQIKQIKQRILARNASRSSPS